MGKFLSVWMTDWPVALTCSSSLAISSCTPKNTAVRQRGLQPTVEERAVCLNLGVKILAASRRNAELKPQPHRTRDVHQLGDLRLHQGHELFCALHKAADQGKGRTYVGAEETASNEGRDKPSWKHSVA